MNIILSMSSFIFPIITFPYISRVLLPEGTGKVSFANSVVSYFVIIAQLGIPTYGIRTCAKVRDDRKALTKVFQEIFIIGMIMCAVSYLLFFSALTFVPKMRAEKTLFIVISSTILFYAIGSEWLYKAVEQYTYITMRSLFFKLIGVVSMFAMIHSKEDYIIYGAISIFASSASNVLNFIHIHKYVDIKPVGQYNLKQHFKPIAVFFAMSCATTIYIHLDAAMLGFMKTDNDVGYYNVATKVKLILVSVVTSLGAVLLPRVSYYIQHNLTDEFEKISRKAFNFVLIVSLPVAIYFMLFAKESVFFLAGGQYGSAITPMQVIIFTVPIIGMTNIMGIQILVPTGREKYVMYSELAGAAVDLILNLILIPPLASTGAAIGTLAAEAAVWIVQFYFLRDMVKDIAKKIRFGLIAAASCAAVVCSLWVKLLGLSNFLTLSISAVLFFGVYAVILLAAKEPIAVFILQQISDKLSALFHKTSR